MNARALAISPMPAVSCALTAHFAPSTLDAFLDLPDPPVARELLDRVLRAPLQEFLSREGKELRARLVVRAWEIAQQASGATSLQALPSDLTVAIELLHAGSLIVDDVEDEAETRRGGPAFHRTHGVASAINAGNWLYFHALELLSRLSLPAPTLVAMQRKVAATLLRCHHGQALDVSVRVAELPQPQVASAVRSATELKTGSLLELSCAVGAIAAGAEPHVERALSSFGRSLGVALQMLDDLCSITSPRRRDKGLEDLHFGRLTWPWAWLSQDLDAIAYGPLQLLGRSVVSGAVPADVLLEQMRGMLGVHGRGRARARLDGAIDVLTEQIGGSPSLDALTSELGRWEASHG